MKCFPIEVAKLKVHRSVQPILKLSLVILYLNRLQKQLVLGRVVWPDDGIKSCLISLKNCPNVATHFLHISDIFRNSPKSHQNIWATSVRQFLQNTCKNHPIWTHWRVQCKSHYGNSSFDQEASPIFYRDRLNCRIRVSLWFFLSELLFNELQVLRRWPQKLII